MGNFTEFYENFFKETPKEKEIREKMDKLTEDYESSDAFIEYNAKMNALIDELRVERTNKRDKNPIKRGQNKVKAVISKKDITNNVDDLKMAEIIEKYNALNVHERRRFFFSVREDDLDMFDNPKTTEKNVDELQEILVQTCIDYVNANNLNDIDEVSFSVDGLGESAKYGEWTLSTDSHIRVVGIQDEVRKKIGENW